MISRNARDCGCGRVRQSTAETPSPPRKHSRYLWTVFAFEFAYASPKKFAFLGALCVSDLKLSALHRGNIARIRAQFFCFQEAAQNLTRARLWQRGDKFNG